MRLFQRSENKTKDILFIINLLLIGLAAPMPFISSVVAPTELETMFGVPFFHIPCYTAIMAGGMGIWFFVLFFAIVLLAMVSAVLARSVNRNFSLIIYLLMLIDILLSIGILNFVCLLWSIAIIALTAITRKEFAWKE